MVRLLPKVPDMTKPIFALALTGLLCACHDHGLSSVGPGDGGTSDAGVEAQAPVDARTAADGGSDAAGVADSLPPSEGDAAVDTRAGADADAKSVPDALPVDGRDATPSTDSTSVRCPWGDASVAPGESFNDGCNTCVCGSTGQMMCTARACPADAAPDTVPDAGPPVCTLTAALSFGSDGGMVAYQDQFLLDTAGAMTITRAYYRGAFDSGVHTCAPALPACGATGVVSIATIASDLGDANVQAALTAGTDVLFGRDTRPVDGTVFAISNGGKGRLLVGDSCPTMASSCIGIPAGIQRLADDLRSLAAAMVAQPVCGEL